jgi:hypothetical protein
MPNEWFVPWARQVLLFLRISDTEASLDLEEEGQSGAPAMPLCVPYNACDMNDSAEALGR